MILISTVSDKYFSLDGIQFARIYQPLSQGSTSIGIYNMFDTRQQLQNSIEYNEISIDGTVYSSQEDAIEAILDVVYDSGITESEFKEYTDKVDYLEENQVTGVEVYSTYAELPTTGTLLVSYKVSNDSDSSLNGYYHWSGSVYVKDDYVGDDFDYSKTFQSFELFRKEFNGLDKINQTSSVVSDTTQRVFHEAVQGIVLNGCTEGAIYNLWFLANNVVTQLDRIIISQSVDEGATWTSWIDSGLTAISKNTDGATSVELVDGVKKASLSVNYNELVNAELYKPWSYMSWDYVTDVGQNTPALIINKSSCRYLEGVFDVELTATELSVSSNYGDGSIEFGFLRFGNNNLYDFGRIIKTDSVGATTTLLSPVTDHFTAYQVDADLNGDGDGSTDPNTGGNHAFNSTGTATASENSVTILINGLEQTTYSGGADTIEIIINNNVQGANTCKADGTGREILTEENRIFISKSNYIKFDVSRKVLALEGITFDRLFLNSLNAGFWDNFRFLSGSEFSEFAVQSGIIKSSVEENSVELYTAADDYVKMIVDNSIGFGRNRIADDLTFLTYQNATKLYQCVVQKAAGLSLATNEQIHIFGKMIFNR